MYYTVTRISTVDGLSDYVVIPLDRDQAESIKSRNGYVTSNKKQAYAVKKKMNKKLNNSTEENVYEEA